MRRLIPVVLIAGAFLACGGEDAEITELREIARQACEMRYTDRELKNCLEVAENMSAETLREFERIGKE